MLDSLEKIVRCVLWLAIASVCVLVPISYLRMQMAEAEVKEVIRKAEATERAAKETGLEAAKTSRLSMASMGAFITALDSSQAEGRIYFTNVSPRAGVLCVYGVAKGRSTGVTSTSMPACEHVDAYASNEKLSVNLAHDVVELCRVNGCDFEVRDAPEAKDQPLLTTLALPPGATGKPGTVPVDSLPAAH